MNKELTMKGAKNKAYPKYKPSGVEWNANTGWIGIILILRKNLNGGLKNERAS